MNDNAPETTRSFTIQSAPTPPAQEDIPEDLQERIRQITIKLATDSCDAARLGLEGMAIAMHLLDKSNRALAQIRDILPVTRGVALSGRLPSPA